MIRRVAAAAPAPTLLATLAILTSCGGVESNTRPATSITWKAPDPDKRACASIGKVHSDPLHKKLSADTAITVAMHDALTCQGALTDDSRAALLWTGMHFLWERHVVGFQTPHRISDLATLIRKERHSVSKEQWRARADATVRFEPGVDGDQSSPRTDFTGVHHPALHVARATITFTATDTIKGDDPPEAETRINHRVRFPLQRADLGNGKLDNYVAVLRGFSLTSKCLNKNQPSGETCNSNGMWPHRLHVGLEKCQREGDALACDFQTEIFRGWTPTNGGGKPLNTRLDMKGTVEITILGGAKDVLVATPSGMLQDNERARQGVITRNATIAGTPGLPHATLGVQAVGFDLLRTDGYKKRGRYMTSLTFGARPLTYNTSTGAMTLKWSAGYKVPVTTLDTVVRYSIRPVLLQLGKEATVMDRRSIKGDVCFTGFAFNCKNRDRVERTVDTRPIQEGVNR